MNRIFYLRVNTLGVRRQTVKASVFSGQLGICRERGEARTRFARVFAVIFDPSGTIHKSARFGKMDLDHGAAQGAWVGGTIFRHVSNGSMFYFSSEFGKVVKIRSLKVRGKGKKNQAADAV